MTKNAKINLFLFFIFIFLLNFAPQNRHIGARAPPLGRQREQRLERGSRLLELEQRVRQLELEHRRSPYIISRAYRARTRTECRLY